MRVATAFSLQPQSERAIAELIQTLQQTERRPPQLILLYFTEQHGADDLLAPLRLAYPESQIMGCSSCQGIMTEHGYHSADGLALACWALWDESGAYGCALAPLQEDIDAVVADLLQTAIARSERPGELPSLVWLHASPGCEEQLMMAIEQRLGSSVAIVGGSAAHNLRRHSGQVLTQDGWLAQGVALTLFYPSCQVATQFHSTYMPAGPRGVVTRAEKRKLLEIDQRPAAEVYNEWTNGLLASVAPGAYVLAETTLFPLARQVGWQAGLSYYKLSHPEVVTARGGLRLFTEIHEGETVILMQGDRSRLLERAVRSSDLYPGPGEVEQIAGLNIFCAGCMLTLDSAMDEVVDSWSLARQGTPFIAPYTFGEQGRFRGGENAHGNLMISTVVFFRQREVSWSKP